MLKAVSARRGMPFEWSFLLDALQTERDQGITIDTTQIRFRTDSRDVVLIDAPGHAEFLRNMITGASQADGAVLIIDALEGVRDQTRRHGYLLHLLGIRQVAVVINKMDRVDFSAARFDEISDEISAHLTGLGVTPTAIIPISARDGDGVAERTPPIGWYRGPTVVEALDALEPARPLEELPLRLPVQAIYKFDDRRIVAGRIESGSLASRRRDRHHAGRQDREDPQRRELAGDAGQRAARAPDARSASRSIANCSSSAATSSPMSASRPRDTRRLRARIFWLHDKPLAKGEQILVRLGTREARATVVAIEKAVDPGELSSVETTAIARNHVGEIDIALAQPIAADPYTDNPRTGRLVIEVNGRIAGGGLVLSVDAGQRAAPVDIVPVESALGPTNAPRATATTARWSGSRACPAPASRPWRARWSGGCSPAAARRCCSTATRCAPGSTAISASRPRIAAKTSAASPKSPRIWPATATSPSSPRCRRRREDRAAARRIADGLFHEIYVATPAEVCESRDPKGHYAKARAGQLKRVYRHRQRLPAAGAKRTDARHLDAADRRSAPTRSSGCWLRRGVLFDDIADLGANI